MASGRPRPSFNARVRELRVSSDERTALWRATVWRSAAAWLLLLVGASLAIVGAADRASGLLWVGVPVLVLGAVAMCAVVALSRRRFRALDLLGSESDVDNSQARGSREDDAAG